MSSTHMLLAPRAAYIAWESDTRYWNWVSTNFCGYTIEEARLIQVSWFNVRWSVNTTDLKPDVWYTASVEILLGSNASGWGPPLGCVIELPDGSQQESQVSIGDRPRNVFFKIIIGRLRLNDLLNGAIQFSLFQHGGHWKTNATCRMFSIDAS